MSNYTEKYKTNYFHVTDEGRYQELCKGLYGDEGGDYLKTEHHEQSTHGADNHILHSFCGDGSPEWVPNIPEDENADRESEFGTFIKELQKILPDDEVFVIKGIGSRKCATMNAYATVVSKTEVKTVDVDDWCEETASELLGRTVNLLM